MLYNILLIIQILVALGIIGLVLIQHGKGADAGAAFGGGASGTVFGSRGSGNFLTKLTTILAAVFFANSLFLAWLVAHPDNATTSSIVPSVVTQQPATTTPTDLPGGKAPIKSKQPENSAPSDIPK